MDLICAPPAHLTGEMAEGGALLRQMVLSNAYHFNRLIKG